MNIFGMRVMGYIQSMILLTSGAAFAVTNTVQVGSNFFSPAKLTNHVGDTILFTLLSGSHTVTGQTESFCGSGAMPASCAVTFPNAGTFPYRCLFHSSSFTLGMVGSVTVLAAAANLPPSVAITSPPNSAAFTAPASFTLEASASDSDGISKVEFFQDGLLIGTDTSAPYSQAISGLAAKVYTFSAVATDSLGAKATNSISVAVQPPPTITILSPTNGAVFTAPATFVIEATTSDNVTNFLFTLSSSISSNSLTTGVCPPESIPEHTCATATNLAADTYRVSAIGTANLGTKVTNSITIIVYAQPLLSSPVRGPAGKFRFDIMSKAGQPIVIQASENLTAWLDLFSTNVPVNTNTFRYTDESATNVNIRFYRTRTP